MSGETYVPEWEPSPHPGLVCENPDCFDSRGLSLATWRNTNLTVELFNAVLPGHLFFACDKHAVGHPEVPS